MSKKEIEELRAEEKKKRNKPPKNWQPPVH
jgi:hypothetical protein